MNIVGNYGYSIEVFFKDDESKIIYTVFESYDRYKFEIDQICWENRHNWNDDHIIVRICLAGDIQEDYFNV